MSMRFSRRTLVALTGGVALGAGGWSTVAAQASTSPLSFPSGQVLTWSDPWTINQTNRSTEILADSVALQGGDHGEAVFGFYAAPQVLDEVATAFLTLIAGDPTLAKIIAGGGEETVGAGGEVEGSSEYQVYNLNLGGEEWGFYVQLVDEVELGVFVAPVPGFAAEMASAQASVQIDGEGVFGGMDGAEFQQYLEEAAPEAAGGEYSDGTGFVNVTWTNGWTEVARDEKGIRLTDPANSVVLYIHGYPTDGQAWQDLADADVGYLLDDQGADSTLFGPTVTENGFSFITDGEFGVRVAQGTPTESPDTYVLTFAADFVADADPAAAMPLVQDAQAAVMLNGAPVLAGLETKFDVG